MKTPFIALLACLTFASVASAQQVPATSTLVIPGCRVDPLSVSGQAQVPAQEAGVLMAIGVREGMKVKADQELASIDDTQAQKQKRVAAAEHQAAREKAANDIDIRHAEMAAKVAEYEYLKNYEAVHGKRGVLGAVSDVDLKRLEFQHQKMLLATQQSKKEQILNGFTAEAKLAEMEAAEDGIQRRKIKSPIAGVVQHVFPNVGEWVKPGDPVFRILRMDKLRVEGLLSHKDANPADLIDRPVVVEVAFAGGQKAAFKGHVVFVDPEVEAAGQRVYAEVENREENGHWLLRPGVGMKPTMTIMLR